LFAELTHKQLALLYQSLIENHLKITCGNLPMISLLADAAGLMGLRLVDKAAFFCVLFFKRFGIRERA